MFLRYGNDCLIKLSVPWAASIPITEPCCIIIDWPISNLEMLAKILIPFLISEDLILIFYILV